MLLSLLNCSCSHFEDFRCRTECVGFSIPYFGQLYYSRLKDARRTDVYVHTSKLRERILAAGSDLVSTHHGKEAVLVFNKDTRRPSILHAIQNLIRFNCSDVESVPREKKKVSFFFFFFFK